jgi:transcriptional regulator with XRE-family HTH domain
MSRIEIHDEELQERIRVAPGQLISSRIKRARKAADLTLDQLGELCGGVSRQHLIKLEKGKHRPRAAMLLRISEATGRSVDWFLDPAIDPSPFPDGDGSGGDA